MIGERSSWLTSEAKRACRSIRLWTASAMSLNELTSRCRSGSDSGARRVSEAARGQVAGGVGHPRERDATGAGWRTNPTAAAATVTMANRRQRGADHPHGPVEGCRSGRPRSRRRRRSADVHADGELWGRRRLESKRWRPYWPARRRVAQRRRQGVLVEAQDVAREPRASEVHEGVTAPSVRRSGRPGSAGGGSPGFAHNRAFFSAWMTAPDRAGRAGSSGPTCRSG